MYKLTALTPLCFQISDNKSVIHCFTKNISSKFIPGDFLINVIFLYDFVIKTLNRNHKYCLCIVVGLSNPEFLFKREVHTSKSNSLDETRLKDMVICLSTAPCFLIQEYCLILSISARSVRELILNASCVTEPMFAITVKKNHQSITVSRPPESFSVQDSPKV